jgi:DNA-binding NtrC family response regulator
VLVVDDEPAVRRSVARLLMSQDFDVLTAEDGQAALALLATTTVDVMLLDTGMPGLSGMQVLDRMKKSHPEIEVIMLAAFGDTDAAVDAVRAGAYDLVTKPIEAAERVALILDRAAERRRLLDRTRSLAQRLEQSDATSEIVGSSAAMQSVYRVALGVAPTASPVLLLGERGTGKELVARAIHQHSARADRPFRAVHCGAIPEALVEAELFGLVGGDAPGAGARPGLFELADEGTLLLDAIGDLPPAAQLMLLRLLEGGAIRRAVGPADKPLDVRVIAATDVDLKERMSAGRFRADLFYRLNVIPIHLPALRQRKDDIPLLAYHFLKKYARRAGREIKRISVESLRQLRDQPWPGNVRELESVIEHAVVMARGDVILPSDLPFARAAHSDASLGEGLFSSELAVLPYADAKDRAASVFDRAYIERLMQRTGGNVSEAARQAGMDRSNFRRLLKKVKNAGGKSGGRGHSEES